MRITGSCFCGYVRFTLSAEATYACHCHCRSCQRAAGAPFVTWATFPRQAFDVTDGAISEHSSSPGVQRGHCAQCGTTLTYAQDRRPGDIDIVMTALDGDPGMAPQAHIWVEDKAPWLELGDTLPKYRKTVTHGELI